MLLPAGGARRMADGEGHWDVYGEGVGMGACGDWVLLDGFIRFLEGLNRIRRRHRSDRIIRVRLTFFACLYVGMRFFCAAANHNSCFNILASILLVVVRNVSLQKHVLFVIFINGLPYVSCSRRAQQLKDCKLPVLFLRTQQSL